MKTIPLADAQARLARSLQQLTSLDLPIPAGQAPLPQTVTGAVRSARETAARAVCLCISASRAEGLAQEVAQDLVADLGAACDLRPAEAEFLAPGTDTSEEGPVFQWGFEACRVLLWALGKGDELALPTETSKPDQIAAIIAGAGSVDALAGKLRDDGQLLDALDLNTRLLAVCREARFVNVPGGLIPQVVAQRQYALLWLLDSQAAPWEDIEVAI